MLEQVESLLQEHREQTYPPTETLSMFVTQVMSEDRSCQNDVNQAAIKSLIKNLAAKSTHTGGYCKARQRLPLALPKEIANFLGRSLEAEVPSS